MDVIAIGDNISDCYLSIGQVFPGGNAVNVAVAASRAGSRAGYIGVVGDDARGQLLIDSLTEESVDVRQLRVASGPTACCQVLHANGERLFGPPHRGVALFQPSAEDLTFAATANIIHTTYCSGLEDVLPDLRRAGRVSFDFSDHLADEYTDSLLPFVQVAEFSAPDLNDRDCEDLARWAAARGPAVVLVTRGSNGALLFDGEQTVSTGPAPADVVDTLGAGDSFTGRVLHGLIRAEPARELLAAGARAAAQTCATWGAYGHGAPQEACCGAEIEVSGAVLLPDPIQHPTQELQP